MIPALMVGIFLCIRLASRTASVFFPSRGQQWSLTASALLVVFSLALFGLTGARKGSSVRFSANAAFEGSLLILSFTVCAVIFSGITQSVSAFGAVLMMTAFAEEVLFRGALPVLFARTINRRRPNSVKVNLVSVVASQLTFSLCHFSTAPNEFRLHSAIAFFVAGLLFANVAYSVGIGLTAGFHASFNQAVLGPGPSFQVYVDDKVLIILGVIAATSLFNALQVKPYFIEW